MTTTSDKAVIYKYENLGLAEIQEVIFPLRQKHVLNRWSETSSDKKRKPGTNPDSRGTLFIYPIFLAPKYSIV